jgi:hypothetical protein
VRHPSLTHCPSQELWKKVNDSLTQDLSKRTSEIGV